MDTSSEDTTNLSIPFARENHCPHYGRDTCLIRFKCCPEKDYPCHKCHNEAITELAEQPGKESRADNQESHGPNNQESHGAATVGEETDRLSTDEFEEKSKNIAEEKGCEKPESLSENVAPIESAHARVTALDGIQLVCTKCGCAQMFSKQCESCKEPFAEYFCPKCQLLINGVEDPYHCDGCNTCRANRADHFHCYTCNVCMAKVLEGNHKCFADRGHDPCAICLEEVFSGAVIFPCFHMVHQDCALKLVLSGSETCPICRGPIFQDEQEEKPSSAEQSIFSRLLSWSRTGIVGNNASPLAQSDPERSENRGGLLERMKACFGPWISRGGSFGEDTSENPDSSVD